VVPLAFAIHAGAKPFSKPIPLVITQIAGTDGAALMIRKKAGILAPADFKNKNISYRNKLSVHFLLSMMFLEKYGLGAQKDLNIKIIELGDMIQSVTAGQTDAFVMPEP
jgi:nitrate/nitrite transport system substrate-binding protein